MLSANNKIQKKRASYAAIASLLNLTFLPILGFFWLLFSLRKASKKGIDHYHIVLGIKLNLVAGTLLFAVSGLMLYFGGFESAWTWVYVITYFMMVHTVFIVIAVWAMVRSWSGQTLLKSRSTCR